MSPRKPHQPTRAATGSSGGGPSALVTTTLHDARITEVHPSRLVIVGQGQRLRIDHDGVTRQPLSDVRLTLPLTAEGTADAGLQRVLASWAGGGMPLRVQDVARCGAHFSRVVHLTDVDGLHATLTQGDGPLPAK